jgi:hypothetical protein
MANLRIDQLPQVDKNTTNDLLPLSQEGTASHATVEQVANSIYRYTIAVESLPFTITYIVPGDSASGVQSNISAAFLSIPLDEPTGNYSVVASFNLCSPYWYASGSRLCMLGDFLVPQIIEPSSSSMNRRAFTIGSGYGFELIVEVVGSNLEFKLAMEYACEFLNDANYTLDDGLVGFLDVLIARAAYAD